MFICKVISCVVDKEYLLSNTLSRIQLVFALLHFAHQGQTGLLLQVYLDFLLSHSNPQWWIDLFFVLVIGSLLGIHRTDKLQLLPHWWQGHRLGLMWCSMACLDNEWRSLCHFWGCTQVLYFRLFCWLWRLLCFFYGILAHRSRYNGHLN